MRPNALPCAVATIGICLWLSACGSDQTPTSPAPSSTGSSPATATYSLTGSVSDQQTGNSIASALVRVMDGPDANKAAVTDPTGAYTLAGLQGGEFTLNVTAPGYSLFAQQVTVRADMRISFILHAATRVVSGTVTDATSRGVLPNILIAVSGGPNAGQSTRSDASGNFTLSGITSDITSVQASATSYLTSNWGVPAGGDVHLNVILARTSGAPSLPPTSPPPMNPTPPSGGAVITFRDGNGNLTTYSEEGFTVNAAAATWAFSSYGAPGPSLQFSTPAGVTTDGEIRITAGGSRFQFRSVDVYSSTTQIPYTFTGMLGSTTVFVITGRQGLTFGNFATVANGQPSTSIDALSIKLSNPAASCCANPMGVDNVILTR
jgi:hypothetical protein